MRQLLGNERITMRQLNNALGDVLAGFDDEDDDVKDEENEEELIIDESPRNPRKGNASKASAIKLKLNVAKSGNEKKTKPKAAVPTSRSTLEDLKMTKAHQVFLQFFIELVCFLFTKLLSSILVTLFEQRCFIVIGIRVRIHNT